MTHTKINVIPKYLIGRPSASEIDYYIETNDISTLVCCLFECLKALKECEHPEGGLHFTKLLRKIYLYFEEVQYLIDLRTIS